MRQTAGILGIPVDHLDNSATLQRLDDFIQTRRFHQVATVNLDFLINANRDRELRQILCDADLVTADGMPIVWASRLAGAPLPERVTGADLVPGLAALAARRGYRIYMLGARPEVAQRARRRMEEQYPGIQIVGCVSPEPDGLSAEACDRLIDEIQRARPDILLVALGNPKQEKWIYRHRERLQGIGVCMGVGGTFDFLAGQTSRAPRWMQRYGMEWLHRLTHEPRRLWRRYARDLIYAPLFFARELWTLRTCRWRSRFGGRAQARPNVDTTCDGGYSVVHVNGALAQTADVAYFDWIATEALAASPHLIVTLAPNVCLGAGALGAIVDLVRRASRLRRDVRIVVGPGNLRRLLQISHVAERVTLHPTLAEAQSTGSARPQGIPLLPDLEANHTTPYVPAPTPLSTGAVVQAANDLAAF